ncbi:MAG TPA: polyphosphate kinase 2 family protein [Bacteroidota bacterium]|nr:polyphosphate kinase 2 family protein [Bacteroidota bacterium]
MNIANYRVDGKSKFKLSKISPDSTGKLKSKQEAEEHLQKNILKMEDLQGKLYAEDNYSVLIIIQAMDTAGKDGAIKHVMSGLNPQGTEVHSFKQPSAEELNHDFLWRAHKFLPQRGQFGIFNRSYYEDILVVRVHDLVKNQKLPNAMITKDIWKQRFREIKDFEKYLFENGTIIIKIFLHISKEEQKKRLLDRINDRSKNWKFSEADLHERGFWDQYQTCYEEAINKTSSRHAPWYIVPANKKWFARFVISEIVVSRLEELKLKFPSLDKNQRKDLEACKKKLLKE